MSSTMGADVVLVIDSHRTYGVGEIASWPEYRKVPIGAPIEIGVTISPDRKFIDISPPVAQNNRASRRRAAAQQRRKA